MRYLVAIICLSFLGASTASAMPVAGAAPLSFSKGDASIVQVARKAKMAKKGGGRKGGKNLGGIHPLVGSGDY